MFPVFVNDGNHEIPDDDILYIVCKEGTYLKKKLGIMESITPVKNISILQSIEMMATMHIKPIPGTLFASVMDFFRQVYSEHKSEAIVLLFYNEEKRVYKIIPPAQEVSGAGVDYNRAMTLEGYTMVGDIHSHANFSAFHSGIDDADEKSFDGLHITIGNNNDTDVSLSASIVSNGQRFIVQPEDYINGIKMTVDIDEVVEKPYASCHVWDATQKKLVPRKSNKTYQVKRFDKRFVSIVSKKYQRCPPEWMKLVEKKQYTYKTYSGGYLGNYGHGTWRNWNTDKFDPQAWTEFNRQNSIKQNANKKSPQANPALLPPPVKPITFPPHNQTTGPYEEVIDNDFNPCEACPFSHHKIDWVMEQIAGLNDDDPDYDGANKDWYECVQCKSVIETEEAMPVCPVCEVDDHLVLLDMEDSDLPESNNEESIVNYQFKCKECATETSVLNHGQCPFCGGEVMDIIDAEALRAASEEDETMEPLPIPVPDEDRIPLSTGRKEGLLARLLKRNKE